MDALRSPASCVVEPATQRIVAFGWRLLLAFFRVSVRFRAVRLGYGLRRKEAFAKRTSVSDKEGRETGFESPESSEAEKIFV